MMFDVNDTNFKGSCLCQDCRYAYFLGDQKGSCKCLKWGTTVFQVGVCKYFRRKDHETH